MPLGWARSGRRGISVHWAFVGLETALGLGGVSHVPDLHGAVVQRHGKLLRLIGVDLNPTHAVPRFEDLCGAILRVPDIPAPDRAVLRRTEERRRFSGVVPHAIDGACVHRYHLRWQTDEKGEER